MINKKTIETAREIRETAAQKWGCKVSEIDWSSCIGMALRGEKMEKEIIETEWMKEDKINAIEKRVDFFLEKKTGRGLEFLERIDNLIENAYRAAREYQEEKWERRAAEKEEEKKEVLRVKAALQERVENSFYWNKKTMASGKFFYVAGFKTIQIYDI